jgi:2-polyprenyl-3-methyl-5-hydroxy-6-metoxy-1,4-benzoquinol methylase
MRRSPLGEPSGPELVARYRGIYGVPTGAPLTEAMIRRHWDLERRLTRELLDSSPGDRWETFERCYTTLYRELPWLNEAAPDPVEAAALYGDWPRYLGPAPKDVYEVGSGNGALARFLAERGYRCRASEITRERGRWDDRSANPSWGQTDGVNLADFEPEHSYDAVISNQVIEHLHPDDVLEHLRSARALVRAGGRYVLCTPHAHRGPADVSAVFRKSRPLGMHLKEYTFAELSRAFRAAGFSSLAAPLQLPGRPARPSRGYLRYLRLAEALLRALPSQFLRRTVARRVTRPPLFSRDVTLIAEVERR